MQIKFLVSVKGCQNNLKYLLRRDEIYINFKF